MREQRAGDEEIGAVTDALRAISRLSGWVAHEINNPLAGIQNAFTLLKRQIPTAHPHYKYVGAIEREIARIAALTQRFHQAYTFDDERTPSLPLERFLVDAARALDQLCAARGVELSFDVDPSVGSEPASSPLLRSAVRHLTQHAIETTPPSGSVRVRAWRADDCIWLAVPDRKVDQMDIRRADVAPPGLALELVERLVHALGGEVKMTGEHDQADAEIRVCFPILAAIQEHR